MQVDFHANQGHFYKNSSTLRLALKQRNEGTWKWPIINPAGACVNSREE